VPLTSHIDDPQSPIAAFLKTRFPNTRSVVSECNKSLREDKTIKPTEPMDGHFGTLGTAIDYRLRYYFAATRYQELVAWKGAMRLIDDGIWKGILESVGGLDLPKRVVADFFQNLAITLAELQPAGRKLSHDDEQLLNRYCIGLALFEQCFRVMPRPSSPLFSTNISSYEDILSIAPSHWIDDLCAMSEAFYDYFRDGLNKEAILNPTFDGSGFIGGADADIILEYGHQQSCLIDFKTSVKASIQGKMLHQLLGYCLLDFSNQYRIERVGFYLPRQGRFIGWQLEDLVHQIGLEPHVSFAELRSEFREVVGSLPPAFTLTQLVAQS